MTEPIIHGKALENEIWLCSLSLDNLEDLPHALHLPTKNFCLLVVMNAHHIANETLYQFAESLIKQGAVYICTWGPDCEQVHDVFDEAREALLPQPTEQNVILTTWHEHDSLNEAMQFAVTMAWPASDYLDTCQSVLFVTVNNQECARQVREVTEKILANAQKSV